MDAEYLADAAVDSALDEEIRTLLTTCFTGPGDAVFKTRRYFHDPYPHRWIVRNASGKLIAHIGVHDKRAHADGQIYRIAGIAEVCVHPDARGQGHIRRMLQRIHEWAAREGFVFAALFGDPKVYASSGYANVDNLYVDTIGIDGTQDKKQVVVMVKSLTTQPWPTGEVHLSGAAF